MYDQHPLIEALLHVHRDALGGDLGKYRNHVYRVFHLSLYFLPGNPASEDVEKLAIAAVFHDIGIWTHHTFDYLEPSTAMAEAYLKEKGRSDWTEAICLLIRLHHKISGYQGPHEQLTEAFRKADWTDLTLGFRRFGLEADKIRNLQRAFPNQGFHRFLVRKSLQNLLRHPTDPLPMFKR